MHMERTTLAYNEALLDIDGDPSRILAMLPPACVVRAVTPAMADACRIPDLAPGFGKNLAHVLVDGQRVVISGCRPAVAFLLTVFHAAQPSSFPLSRERVAVYFLVVPAVAPHHRRARCFEPRPAGRRRGDQSELFA